MARATDRAASPNCTGAGILAGAIPVLIATNSNGPPPLQAVIQTALHTATSHR
jgi:hypothetical protein